MTLKEIILRRLGVMSASNLELQIEVESYGYTRAGMIATLKKLRVDGLIVTEGHVSRIVEVKS
jgi:hypothetical protein